MKFVLHVAIRSRSNPLSGHSGKDSHTLFVRSQSSLFAWRRAAGWRGSDFAYCINLLFFSNTYKKVRVLTKGK
jgi:hypothetical protein